MSRLGEILEKAFQDYFLQKLEETAHRRNVPRLALTEAQQSRLVEKIRADFQGLADRRTPSDGVRSQGVSRKDDSSKHGTSMNDTHRNEMGDNDHGRGAD